MKAPRIGTGNMSLPEDILGDVQLTPPTIASARSQITGRRRRFSAMKAKARRSFDFMSLETDHDDRTR
jgi:hypothetical protein